MYTEEDITTAVTKGIFSQESAEAFRGYMATQQESPAIDEEDFRLVTSFNDIFVVIICLLLLASVALIAGSIKPWIGALAETGAAWALAEIFTRKRHMALPSIILVFAFVGGALMTVLLAMATHTPVAQGTDIATYGKAFYLMFIAAGLFAMLAAALHWWRFHVPITVAAAVSAGGLILVATTEMFFPATRAHTSGILFALGLVAFALAMRWDMSDPERLTRRSDVAFWLHLLAAPLLVEPIFMSLGVFNGHTSIGHGLTVLALYLVIAFISLSIDRRALMASALVYVIFTMTDVLKEQGMVNLSFAITGLIIGSALLTLSIYWHPARTFMLRRFPPVLQSRLPPSRQA